MAETDVTRSAYAIRIMPVDDNPVTRRGSRDTLEDEADFEVAGEAGNLFIPEDAVRREFRLLGNGGGWKPAPELLSAREREVLTRFATGKAYAEIADDMGLKKVTVRNTIYRVQNKLGMASQQEIVVWAVRNGLLDEE